MMRLLCAAAALCAVAEAQASNYCSNDWLGERADSLRTSASCFSGGTWQPPQGSFTQWPATAGFTNFVAADPSRGIGVIQTTSLDLIAFSAEGMTIWQSYNINSTILPPSLVGVAHPQLPRAQARAAARRAAEAPTSSLGEVQPRPEYVVGGAADPGSGLLFIQDLGNVAAIDIMTGASVWGTALVSPNAIAGYARLTVLPPPPKGNLPALLSNWSRGPASLLIVDGSVYSPTPGAVTTAQLVAMAASSGQQLWTWMPAPTTRGYCTPPTGTADGKSMLVLCSLNATSLQDTNVTLFSVNTVDGSVAWQTRLGPIVAAAAQVPAGAPLVPTGGSLGLQYFSGSLLVDDASGTIMVATANLTAGANMLLTLSLADGSLVGTPDSLDAVPSSDTTLPAPGGFPQDLVPIYTGTPIRPQLAGILAQTTSGCVALFSLALGPRGVVSAQQLPVGPPSPYNSGRYYWGPLSLDPFTLAFATNIAGAQAYFMQVSQLGPLSTLAASPGITPLYQNTTLLTASLPTLLASSMTPGGTQQAVAWVYGSPALSADVGVGWFDRNAVQALPPAEEQPAAPAAAQMLRGAGTIAAPATPLTRDVPFAYSFTVSGRGAVTTAPAIMANPLNPAAAIAVYAGSDDDTVRAVDLQTGVLLWSLSADDINESEGTGIGGVFPTIVGSWDGGASSSLAFVVFVDWSGNVFQVSLLTGEVLNTLYVGDAVADALRAAAIAAGSPYANRYSPYYVGSVSLHPPAAAGSAGAGGWSLLMSWAGSGLPYAGSMVARVSLPPPDYEGPALPLITWNVTAGIGPNAPTQGFSSQQLVVALTSQQPNNPLYPQLEHVAVTGFFYGPLQVYATRNGSLLWSADPRQGNELQGYYLSDLALLPFSGVPGTGGDGGQAGFVVYAALSSPYTTPPDLVVRFDLTTGARVWGTGVCRIGGIALQPPPSAGGDAAVLVTCGDAADRSLPGKVAVLSQSSGDILFWSGSASDVMVSAPAVIPALGQGVYGEAGGALTPFDLGNGSLVQTFTLSGAAPGVPYGALNVLPAFVLAPSTTASGLLAVAGGDDGYAYSLQTVQLGPAPSPSPSPSPQPAGGGGNSGGSPSVGGAIGGSLVGAVVLSGVSYLLVTQWRAGKLQRACGRRTAMRSLLPEEDARAHLQYALLPEARAAPVDALGGPTASAAAPTL